MATHKVKSASALLNVASATAMENTLRGMRHQLRQQHVWLTATHPYTNVVDTLKSSPLIISGNKLAEYIAASIPLHVVDGWVFLSRAFDSIKSGDLNTAVHLAYYAELRAAMSLLASEGVGVFSGCHVAIDRTFDSHYLKGIGTHKVTWELIDSWAKDFRRVATLLTAVKVESRTIDDWFDEASIAQSVQHLVTRDWLESWSVDIRNFEVDHRFRNHTSYRPSAISPSSMAVIDTTTEVINPLIQTWDALAPSAEAGGAAIDRVLLFRAFALAHNQPSTNSDTWAAFVDRLQGVASASLQAQLKNQKTKDNYVLKWADCSSDPPPAQAVLARATLLLRIANGVCAQRLEIAQVTKKDLVFWWTRFGENGGLWLGGAEPDSFAELWGEVDSALDDVEDALGLIHPPKPMATILPIFGRNVALTQFSRVPLWLLGVDANDH